MSRLTVTLCAIFLIHQHQIPISYSSSLESADAFEMKGYNHLMNTISNIGNIEVRNTSDKDALFHNRKLEINNIMAKLDLMMDINDIKRGKFDESIFYFANGDQMLTSYNILKWDLDAFDIAVVSENSSYAQSFQADTEERYIEVNQNDFNMIIEQLISDLKTKSLFVPSSMDEANICEYNFSLLTTLADVFRRMVVLGFKSYLMHEYADFIHRLAGNYGDYPDGMANVNSEIVKLQTALLQFLGSTIPDGTYGCTAGEPIRGEETVEIEGVFQTFIALEPDMNNGHCTSETCPIVPSRRISNDYSLKGYYQTKPCHGEVVSCIGVEKVEICYADESSVKRYEGLNFNDQIYGNMASCPGEKHTIQKWRRMLLTCDVCICTCLRDTRDTSRTQDLSYADQTSDIENNMVVTNVRFVEKDKVIHIQIEQESLSSLKSSSDSTTRSWKPISNDNVERKQVMGMQRILHLDDVIVPHGYLVTGVKFGPYKPEEGLLEGAYHKFQIRVRATPYDENKNELMISENGESSSVWITPETMDTGSRPDYKQDRTSVHSMNIEQLYEPSLLVRNIKDSTPNQYLAFRSSDLQDDAGQSTIPYFDSRPPFSKKKFPLIGVGISLKSYNGHNGYLTLKTIPFMDTFVDKYM